MKRSIYFISAIAIALCFVPFHQSRAQTIENIEGITPISAESSSSEDAWPTLYESTSLNYEDSLVKGESSSAVYYVGYDGMRYVFPHERVFFSWYEDFSDVAEISDADLASIPIGGNITYKPGSVLVKIQTDPKVYAIGLGGKLRWVTSEAIAKNLYGVDWAKKVQDVPDAFFTDYDSSRSILTVDDYNPAWLLYTESTVYELNSSSNNDPADLPADVPVYPKGSVTSVYVYDEDAGYGSVNYDTAETATSVRAWFEKRAPELGWKLEKSTIIEQMLTGLMETSKATKVVDGVTVELKLWAAEGYVSITREESQMLVDTSKLPSYLPVYPNTDLMMAGELDKDIFGYLGLSTSTVTEQYNWFEPKIRESSWNLVNSKDQDTRIIRQYQRMVGTENKNLALIIIDVGDTTEHLVITMVAYGPSTMFDDVSLDEISKSFDSLTSSSTLLGQ